MRCSATPSKGDSASVRLGLCTEQRQNACHCMGASNTCLWADLARTVLVTGMPYDPLRRHIYAAHLPATKRRSQGPCLDYWLQLKGMKYLFVEHLCPRGPPLREIAASFSECERRAEEAKCLGGVVDSRRHEACLT